MNQLKKDKSFIDILRDTKHNDKANQVFLKLLAKQKKGANPFDVVRSETYPSKEIKPGGNPYDPV